MSRSLPLVGPAAGSLPPLVEPAVGPAPPLVGPAVGPTPPLVELVETSIGSVGMRSAVVPVPGTGFDKFNPRRGFDNPDFTAHTLSDFWTSNS